MRAISLLLLTPWQLIAAESAPIVSCLPSNPIYDSQSNTLEIPEIISDNNEKLIFQAQLIAQQSESPFLFQLSKLIQHQNTSSNLGANYSTQDQLLTIPSLCIRSNNADQAGYQVQLQAIPNSQPMLFLLKSASDITGSSIYDWQIAQNKGAIMLKEDSDFDNLAAKANTLGLAGVRELKFIMTDLNTSSPVLFFINSNTTPLHYDFVRNTLNRYQNINYDNGLTQFIAETYFRDNRNYLAGSVVAYDNYSDADNKGIYALEFWPTDPVPAKSIEQAYHAISAAMPFLPSPLAYHPVGTTHEQEYAGFAQQFSDKNIRTVHTDSLFSQLDSTVLNKGEAYGRLKVFNPGDNHLSEDIIAIYTFIPNNIAHAGGIITTEPQTPLSHINLKARQNNTPNAYIKNALTDPTISKLIDHWVHYYTTDDGIFIEAASEATALQWLADKIPSEITTPESDLSHTAPTPLTELEHSDWIRVGVKAANVAELAKILDEGITPKGYALPFALYNNFMSLQRCANDLKKLCTNSNSISLNEYVAQLLTDEEFNQNIEIRRQRLAELRDLIEQAEAPESIINQIESVRLFWEPEGQPFSQKLRVRSSTNNEDLEGFNGAGLYGSFTHKPKEGKLINSIKQVWASLWNESAFEERRLHRIDHLKTYMGVLIHPNYGDEQANGVAITKNIFNAGWQGIYINAQYGELSITNPEPIESDAELINPIPDEFIITHLAASVSGFTWETQYIRHSNVKFIYDEPVTTENVLLANEINQLRDNLLIIHSHFKELYQGDANFAMDIEFKITETTDGSRGKLAIKQARPWVD